MFTFVIMSYNQEEFVIQHLESIKYQIEKFAGDMKVELIFSDDGSTDQTISLAQMWLKENKELFHNIQFFEVEENQGIVKNYLKATGAIQTPYYNVIGADDLYYKNDIFETTLLLDKYEILFTPLLAFNEKGVSIHWDLMNLLTLQTKKQIQNFLKHSFPFNTSGSFYKTSLVQNEVLREYISKYTWIEDLPSIYYLFNIKDSLEYTIYFKPYVVYRDSVGISKSKENAKNIFFEEEEEAIKADLGMMKVKKGLNLDYLRVAFAYKYNSFQANVLPTNRAIKRKIEQEVDEALDYLAAIEERTNVFLETVVAVEKWKKKGRTHENHE